MILTPTPRYAAVLTNATMIAFVGSQFTNDDDEATLQVRVGLDVLDWPSIKGSNIW
jgi:hypothetical protein